MKKYLYISLPLLLLGSFAFRSQKNIIQLTASKLEKKISVKFKFNSSFGIQKKADNEILVYKLNVMTPSELSVKDQVERFGTLVNSVKKLKGKTSKKDKKYFSKVKPLKIVSEKFVEARYALKTKLFYCSFTENYCSVDRQYLLVK